MSNATGDLITRVYSNFRGVDFRGEEINLIRSPDSLNMWKDYKETESIRTRPGLRLHTDLSKYGPVYNIFFYKGSIIAHCGFQLVRIPTFGLPGTEWGSLTSTKSNGFIFEDVFYFLCAGTYIQYDGERSKPVEGYVPTTSIARAPSGGGTDYQGVNMLSDYRINTFRADGASKEFYLDVMNIDSDFVPVVKVDDKEVTDFTVDYAAGKIIFTSVPSQPLTDGQDNVSIKFKKAIPEYRNSILNCTLLQVFDNRVFVSGNPDRPNMVWHSSLNDPSYFSDLDFYQEGMDDAAVKGMVAGNNGLWVFREPSEANTSVFYHTPAMDDEYGKIYPSSHSSVNTGCIGKAINFNDDIVFFSERGMEGISGDITTEQVIAHRSTLVDRKMITQYEYKDMILVEWEGYLLVCISGQVFLADSRTAFTNEDHVEYEWFYWMMEKPIKSAAVYNGTLYFGTYDGIYALDDVKKDIESYWVTPKDKFKYPHKLKTTNKRGCVVEAEGDLSVYVKTEKTDFELIGEYPKVTDYFVSRIKRKKFKDIQLKFHSNTRFSLETATLECFIGGYIKR